MPDSSIRTGWWRRGRQTEPNWQQERELVELRRERSDLRRVLASLGEGVLAIDPNGIVLYANPMAVELLGLDEAQCVGSHLYVALPHPELCVEIEDVVRHAVSGDDAPTTRDVEIVVPRPDGDVALAVHVAPLRRAIVHADRVPEGAIAVVRDVTELRRLERARQDFFANVSHELTTPVTAISGSLETIVDDPDMPDDVRVRFLSAAMAHADRLRALVADLLSLARLERDPTALRRAPTDLSLLVPEVIANLEHAARERNVRVVVDAGTAGMPRPEIDAEAVRQALSNLIDNAIAHSDAAGEVLVAIREVDAGQRVELAVTDTGSGIPPEALDRVFERFYRVDVDRSRSRGGTGIGLSIAKHVASAHGGSIVVESIEGQGSTFRLRLPVSRDGSVGTPSG